MDEEDMDVVSMISLLLENRTKTLKARVNDLGHEEEKNGPVHGN